MTRISGRYCRYDDIPCVPRFIIDDSNCQNPLGGWQSKNWDPAINSKSFDNFCAAMGKPSNATVQIAPGLKVTQATINYATFMNRV